MVNLVKDQSDIPDGEKSIIIDPSGSLLSDNPIETTDVNPLSNRLVRFRSKASVTDNPTDKVVGLVGLSVLDDEIFKPLTPPRSYR